MDKVAWTNIKRSIIGMYFIMTTFVSVGLGDYYPVNDVERLVGAFVLLLGTATFSYF